MKSKVENYSTEKKPFCLYLTIPPQPLQSKESGFVQTLQCKFFCPCVRVINHFAARRAALCGHHVLFLTAQRCFDDGWQSSVSGSCLLALLIGGNVSEPVGMSEWPNYEGVENARANVQRCEQGWCPSPNGHARLPALQSACKALEDGMCQLAGERKGGGIGCP